MSLPASEYASVGELRLHVLRWPGQGPLFVLLHGLSSNSRTWTAVARELNAAGAHIVAVDQRGHGLSDKPDRGYGFDQVAADLAALLDALAPDERPILAGQSWGGNVALHFAARYPSRVRGLVLVDGGFLEPSARPGATWEQIEVKLAPPPLAGLPRDEIVRRIRAAHPDWSDEGIQATLGNFETLPDGTVRPWLSRDRHMQILRALWDHHPSELYHQIAAPTLIVPAIGSDPSWDEIRRLVERAVETLPRARVVWFPGAAHDIHVHRPGELASVMLAALNEGFFDS